MALAAASLFASGCGYIGAPLVPLANVPQKITDLAVIQRGDSLIVHCSLPLRTTENILIKTPVKLDLRIGVPNDPFNAAEWAQQAKSISNPDIKDTLVTYQISTREWTGKSVVLGVRAIGSNGKDSDWSNFQTIPVVIPPETPSVHELEITAAGVKVTWTGRGDQFRVLRSGGDANFAVMATVTAHEWLDTTIEYGKPYSYMVQALADLGNQRVAESGPRKSTPPRTFEDNPAGPLPPGCAPIPLPTRSRWCGKLIPNPILAGYRVYRAVGEGPFEKLADVNAVPSYSDTAIEHGKTYRYVLTALDKSNNESARSRLCTSFLRTSPTHRDSPPKRPPLWRAIFTDSRSTPNRSPANAIRTSCCATPPVRDSSSKSPIAMRASKFSICRISCCVFSPRAISR